MHSRRNDVRWFGGWGKALTLTKIIQITLQCRLMSWWLEAWDRRCLGCWEGKYETLTSVVLFELRR
jgi:hypothetical protein